MKSWFSQRGCPQKLIENEPSTVKFSGQRVFHRAMVEKGVSLVVTYHPVFKSIGKIIYDNLYLLCINKELKHLFTLRPMVSYRGSRKVGSYLVRAKLYQIERSVGSFIVKDCIARFVYMLMRRTFFPVRLQEKRTKLIINLTALRNRWFISLLVINVENNMLVKQLTLFARGGIITNLTLVDMRLAYYGCKKTCTNIFVIVNIMIFSMISQ